MTEKPQKLLLADKVYEDLCAFILAQGLGPGDRLTIDDLVRKFGVSQTPVRQALSRLQADGLVVNKPNTGFRVSDVPSKKLLLDTLDTRLMIEPELAARAARHSDKALVDRLNTNLGKLNRSSANGHRELFLLVQSDADFHRLIAAAANNSVALDALDRLHRRTTVFRLKFSNSMPREVISEHQAIADAIRDKLPDEAARAMRCHLATSMKRVENAE